MWASIRIISSACCNLINSINKQKSFINTTNFTNKHLGNYCNDFHRPAAVLNQKCELPLAAGNEDFNFNVAALQTNNKVSLTSETIQIANKVSLAQETQQTNNKISVTQETMQTTNRVLITSETVKTNNKLAYA